MSGKIPAGKWVLATHFGGLSVGHVVGGGDKIVKCAPPGNMNRWSRSQFDRSNVLLVADSEPEANAALTRYKAAEAARYDEWRALMQAAKAAGMVADAFRAETKRLAQAAAGHATQTQPSNPSNPDMGMGEEG